jgi:predicted metal-dependent peptidase
MVKLNDCKKEQLKNIKIKGRSGTQLCSFFSEYEKNVGECNFLIVITDGFLCDIDISEMRDPGIQTYWLITSNNTGFKPPFGKVFLLRN